LYANDLATKKDVDDFANAHPDPRDVAALDSDINRAEWDLRGDTADAKAIAKFNNYDSGERAGGYDVSALLKFWLQEKHQSWVHYVDFINDVDKGEDSKKVFETYMKDGASLPINLPKGVQEPVEHALANGGKPDFAPARKLIVGIVNQKFIPEFKKDRLALYQKDIKANTEKLSALKKKRAAMGK
jgi:hypothetical protein